MSKKITLWGLGIALTCGLSNPVQADEIELTGSAGVDVASAYIFRGATVNKEWNVQPFAEVGGLPFGITVGTWGNFNTDTSDFDEIDYYASIPIPLPEDSPFGLSVGYTEYTFPTAVDGVTGLGLEADREINITLELDTILSPYAAVNFGLEGPFLDEGIYWELGAGHEETLDLGGEEITLSGGVAVGIESGDNVAESGVSYTQLSAGAAWKALYASLNWVIETDDKVLVVDEDFYAVIGLSL